MPLLDNKFDACSLSARGKTVSFPPNSNSNCQSSDPDCGSDGLCKTCPNLAEAHDSCHGYSGETFSQDADGTITTSFGAYVDAAPGGCCQANSCIGAYFESKVASMSAGDKVYFDYQAFAGGDWFEVAIGLYDDMNHLEQCKVYRGNAMDDYTNDYFDIPLLGNYKLGFFAGSYDRTGGTVLGATLKVKAFQMTVPIWVPPGTAHHHPALGGPGGSGACATDPGINWNDPACPLPDCGDILQQNHPWCNGYVPVTAGRKSTSRREASSASAGNTTRGHHDANASACDWRFSSQRTAELACEGLQWCTGVMRDHGLVCQRGATLHASGSGDGSSINATHR